MKFAFIGAGGVGGYFGGLLAYAGEDVTFVARGAHYAALAAEGLTLRAQERSFENLPVKAVDSIAKLEAPDVVFVTTKTYDRDDAAAALSRVVSPSTIVIPLQNGIDNDIQIKKFVTNARVYPGLCYIFSTRTAPGLIEQTGGPKTVLFGERGVSVNASLTEIEAVMKRAGILATASQDIETAMWAKFVRIVTLAGLTGLCRSPIGPIVTDDEGLRMYLRCTDEAIAVAHAAGVRIDDALRAKILSQLETDKTTGAGAKSSLLVDIENGRETEIEMLNGAIVRLAKEKGIPVPTHELIYNAVRIGSAQRARRNS